MSVEANEAYNEQQKICKALECTFKRCFVISLLLQPAALAAAIAATPAAVDAGALAHIQLVN